LPAAAGERPFKRGERGEKRGGGNGMCSFSAPGRVRASGKGFGKENSFPEEKGISPYSRWG